MAEVRMNFTQLDGLTKTGKDMQDGMKQPKAERMFMASKEKGKSNKIFKFHFVFVKQQQ